MFLISGFLISGSVPPAWGGAPVKAHPPEIPAAPPAPAPAITAQPAPAPTTVPPPAKPAPPDRLTSIAHSDRLAWGGVAIARDGRVFVVFPRIGGNPGPSVATIDAGGAIIPYPGGAWNEPTDSDAKADAGEAFIGVTAIRLAPDNSLWVVDSGVPGLGKPPVARAAKIVRFDLATNAMTRGYSIPPEVLRPRSLIEDIRFNGGQAYIADTGAPGLIVLDLTSGVARRLLDGDPSTTGQRPVMVDGETVKGSDNQPVMFHASTLEVTPDGKYLYYQPRPGPLVRIPTALLDDPKAPAKDVALAVQFWYDTPALGGSAIAPDGTLYLDDLENDSVLSLTPDRVLATLIHDPRLHWAANPFLRDGTLTLPVAQFDRAAAFHHGKSQIRFPLELFTLRLAPPPTPTGRH